MSSHVPTDTSCKLDTHSMGLLEPQLIEQTSKSIVCSLAALRTRIFKSTALKCLFVPLSSPNNSARLSICAAVDIASTRMASAIVSYQIDPMSSSTERQLQIFRTQDLGKTVTNNTSNCGTPPGGCPMLSLWNALPPAGRSSPTS